MKLAVFDTETTDIDGIDRYDDRGKPVIGHKYAVPVQIGIITVDTKTQETKTLVNALCNPGVRIVKGASDIHKITDSMVYDKAAAREVAQWAQAMCEWDGADVLVGFNSKSFDAPLLNRYSTDNYWMRMPHIDVLDVAYRYFPHFENHRLGTLYRELIGSDASQAHDALADVIYTYQVMEAMRKKLGMTLEKLIDDMKTPRPYTIMPIGKHKGKPLSEVPRSWGNYLLSVNKEDDTMRADLRATCNVIAGRA